MTDPALAVDGARLGRLYRRPGQPLPERAVVSDNGSVSLRTRQAEEQVLAGALVPSITNVIDTLNKPHLLTWTAKKVASEAVAIERRWPGRITGSPEDAFTYLKGAADRDRDQAASQGTAVHDACEQIARGNPCPPLTPEQMSYVDAWKAWLDRWQPEFLHLETTVFGSAAGLRYAGTTDFIARINGIVTVGDYKTTRTGLHDEVALQLAAVAHADELSPDNVTLEPMVEVQAGVAVHLSPDGYQVKPVILGGRSWQWFCSLRLAWEFSALEGRTPDGEKVLGRVMRGPEDLMASFTRTVAA